MYNYPKSLEALINSFSLLPGVGKKTAERFAFSVLNQFSTSEVEEFIYNLDALKNLHQCPNCGCLTDDDLCPICKDPNRNKRLVMVVEQVKDVFVLEKLNEYQGIYHVLNGAIEFSKGINISDLNIDSLLEKAKNKEVDEIILATNATLEGETTAKYLKELLNDYPEVKVSRIAYGLPVGSDLAYADQMTLLKALEGRRNY